ncbi:HNH endonuclease [Priestia megaterium]|uniref:HNH endonuclease n=2 Tax=Priestia megaterium TaxID=1404 RepID=UPI00277E68BF|nr:HNH endonuclease [Priestia megaterium]MDQ0807914.1 5-methylcytosine-specific restriction protein A [Priestia megaterium]
MAENKTKTKRKINKKYFFERGETKLRWMISANGKMYDHASAFNKFGYIDWRQNRSYEMGDIVYIYCTRPAQKVMFKTQVKQVNIAFHEVIDDKEFWLDKKEYEKSQSGQYVRLQLLEQVDTDHLSLEKLTLNGLKRYPQGPIKVKEGLASYMDKYFDDYYSEGFFHDEENLSIYEGHKRTIRINKYERSSIARAKCIEEKGIHCVVCDIDFQEVYGEVGEGFIHVHHIVPLHSIGKEYKVDYKSDLVPVCPNCHAMLHRKVEGRYLEINELKEIYRLRNGY